MVGADWYVALAVWYVALTVGVKLEAMRPRGGRFLSLLWEIQGGTKHQPQA